jgi:hypothetical protein
MVGVETQTINLRKPKENNHLKGQSREKAGEVKGMALGPN